MEKEIVFNKNIDNIEIGKRIRQARESAGLTLQDVANKVGVASSTILRYESGEIKKIKIPVIKSIASELHIDPMWLLGKDDITLDFEYVHTEKDGRKYIIKKIYNDNGKEIQENPMDVIDTYYLNAEAAIIAQEIYDNPDLRLLFDTTRKVYPEDLKLIAKMVSKMVKEENR